MTSLVHVAYIFPVCNRYRQFVNGAEYSSPVLSAARSIFTQNTFRDIFTPTNGHNLNGRTALTKVHSTLRCTNTVSIYL